MNKELIIVDDDFPFRERLSRSMEKKGFNVEAFNDYKSAFKRIAEKKFNFAIVTASSAIFAVTTALSAGAVINPTPRWIIKLHVDVPATAVPKSIVDPLQVKLPDWTTPSIDISIAAAEDGVKLDPPFCKV